MRYENDIKIEYLKKNYTNKFILVSFENLLNRGSDLDKLSKFLNVKINVKKKLYYSTHKNLFTFRKNTSYAVNYNLSKQEIKNLNKFLKYLRNKRFWNYPFLLFFRHIIKRVAKLLKNR